MFKEGQEVLINIPESRIDSRWSKTWLKEIKKIHNKKVTLIKPAFTDGWFFKASFPFLAAKWVPTTWIKPLENLCTCNIVFLFNNGCKCGVLK